MLTSPDHCYRYCRVRIPMKCFLFRLNMAESCQIYAAKMASSERRGSHEDSQTAKLQSFILHLVRAIANSNISNRVIGTAIAINLLIPQIPLVAGCAISIVDVLLILLFYRPNGSMKGLRAFEFFVIALVLGVVVCFCIQLSLIKDTSVGEVFRGYLPSSAIAQSEGYADFPSLL